MHRPEAALLGVLSPEQLRAPLVVKEEPFSVSSVLGLLALLGVSVETAVILVSYINKLWQEGLDIRTATRQASLLRLHTIPL